jgi:hypothetical protein
MAQRVFVCNEIEMKDRDVALSARSASRSGLPPRGAYAYRNHCLHRGGPARGIIRDHVVDLLGPDKTFLGQTYDRASRIVCLARLGIQAQPANAP